PRHTILVDTCVGNHKDRPGRPMFDQLDLPYLADLAAAGVQPEEVDFVLCTHLHVDHVGWNTRLLDGRWVPTFPNAKYIFARKEYEFWEQRHLDGTEGKVPNVYDDSVLPVMEAGQAVLVDMDHQIDDGMWFEPAPGHTEGNVVLNLQSQGANAVLSGDVMHHPIQLVRPEWSSRACEDVVQSAATRRALIERYVNTDTLIAPAHFASPTMGHIISRGDAFGYRLIGEG
ncbi:MAG: MBL fold metallo-hydrolase, partial [Rhodospirillaceae bacterium]|nr:MBL fold metallo-hydrolase [Rhodospirillaceae bacterium]